MNKRARSTTALLLCALSLATNRAQERDVDVLIVDGMTGAPIANADVWWTTIAPAANEDRSWITIEDLNGFGRIDLEATDRNARASGCSGRSDAAGHLRIASSASSLNIVATKLARWGGARFWRSDESELRLELFENNELEVRVVDSLDAAVDGGVVWLCRQDALAHEPLEDRYSAGIIDGVAHFPHFGAYIRAENKNVEGAPPAWFVQLGMLHDELATVAVTSETRGPIVLTLPPSGEVELEFVDANGHSVTPEVPVMTVGYGDIAEGRGIEDLALRPHASASSAGRLPRVHVVDGKALLHDLPLGKGFSMYVMRNEASAGDFVEFAGPRSVGERTHVRVEVGRKLIGCVARLLQPDGTPLANARVDVIVQHDPNDRTTHCDGEQEPTAIYYIGPPRIEPPCSVTSHALTDSEGRLRVDLLPSTAESGAPTLILQHDLGRANALAARFALKELWRVGVLELGDVVLAPPPVFAAGRIVALHGAPLRDVEVRWSWSSWNRPLLVRTDANGRFEMRSALLCDQVVLDVTAPGYPTPEVRPRKSGATNFDLSLFHPATLSGRLLTDTGSAMHSLEVLLQQLDERANDFLFFSATIDPVDRSFKRGELRPGRWRLIVKSRTSTVIRDLTFRDGEILDVGDIDLRSAK